MRGVILDYSFELNPPAFSLALMTFKPLYDKIFHVTRILPSWYLPDNMETYWDKLNSSSSYQSILDRPIELPKRSFAEINNSLVVPIFSSEQYLRAIATRHGYLDVQTMSLENLRKGCDYLGLPTDVVVECAKNSYFPDMIFEEEDEYENVLNDIFKKTGMVQEPFEGPTFVRGNIARLCMIGHALSENLGIVTIDPLFKRWLGKKPVKISTPATFVVKALSSNERLTIGRVLKYIQDSDFRFTLIDIHTYIRNKTKNRLKFGLFQFSLFPLKLILQPWSMTFSLAAQVYNFFKTLKDYHTKTQEIYDIS